MIAATTAESTIALDGNDFGGVSSGRNCGGRLNAPGGDTRGRGGRRRDVSGAAADGAAADGAAADGAAACAGREAGISGSSVVSSHNPVTSEKRQSASWKLVRRCT